MNTSSSEPLKRINSLVDHAGQVIISLRSRDHNGELHDPEDLELPPTRNHLYEILSLIDAIKTVQGTSKIYISESVKTEEGFSGVQESLERLQSILEAIFTTLTNKNPPELSKQAVIGIIRDRGGDERQYYTLVGILSSLNIVTSNGRGPIGGIKLYDSFHTEHQIKEAEQQVTEQKGQFLDLREEAQRRHEEALYPSASKVMSDNGYQMIITGVQRRFPGKWNTPDLVGYKIIPLSNLGGAEIEVVTVEVKWEMSKPALAEAMSHQQLAHRTYLMVHQEFAEIEPTMIADLRKTGIGLICKNDTGHSETSHTICLLAQKNNADKATIDNFLGSVMGKPEMENIRREIAKSLFNDFFKLLTFR